MFKSYFVIIFYPFRKERLILYGIIKPVIIFVATGSKFFKIESRVILTIYKGSKINYRKRKRRLRPGVKWIAAVLAAAVVLIVVICIL